MIKLKEGLIKRVNNFTLKRKIDKFRNTSPDIIEKFENSINTYREGGGFKYNWNFQLFKLISLYEFIKVNKVEKILELGTGSTTSAISEYLKENPQTSALCIDESSFWIKNTTESLQINGQLPNNLKLLHCQRIINDTIPLSTRYKFDYEKQNDFDLVIVDGPSTIIGEHYDPQNYNSDVLEILKYHKPSFILIDNRKSTYEVFLESHSDSYNFSDTFIWRNDKKIFTSKSMNFYSILSLK